MAKNFLKISKQAYETQVSALETLIGRLDGAITNYETKRNEMDKFIENGDDHYETSRAGVEQNIKICRKYRKMTEQSIKALKEILQNMDDLGDNAKETLTPATDTAGQIAKTVLEVTNLLD